MSEEQSLHAEWYEAIRAFVTHEEAWSARTDEAFRATAWCPHDDEEDSDSE